MKKEGLELILKVKNKIRALMQTKNITETELADRMEMSQQNLNRIMNKSNDIKLSTIEKAAESIGVDISELIPFNIVQNNNDSVTATQENNVTVHDKKSVEEMFKHQNELNLEMMKLLKIVSEKLDKI